MTDTVQTLLSVEKSRPNK